jgi:hypothetical protein
MCPKLKILLPLVTAFSLNVAACLPFRFDETALLIPRKSRAETVRPWETSKANLTEVPPSVERCISLDNKRFYWQIVALASDGIGGSGAIASAATMIGDDKPDAGKWVLLIGSTVILVAGVVSHFASEDILKKLVAECQYKDAKIIKVSRETYAELLKHSNGA